MVEPAQPSFTPKQCIPKSASLFQEIIGNTSEQVCQKLFPLLSSILLNAKIHDNGCGTGEVTGEIMKTPNLPPNVHIFATDRNAYIVEGCQKKVDASNWPVTTKVVKAQDWILTMPFLI
ncbi:hypothetical protein B0J14DRAFT_558031 [Halenospora varia]|nr:hypothetical protein B0J14DRAFT_558031 [Halenospora varia]